MKISERIVFAFEWRPLSWGFTRLDQLNSFTRIAERVVVVSFVLGGGGNIAGVAEVDLGTKVIRFVGENLRAALIGFGEIFLVDQYRQPLLPIVALIEHDPLLQVIR